MVISVNRDDTSIPVVMAATTFFTVSSYASGLRITSGLFVSRGECEQEDPATQDQKKE